MIHDLLYIVGKLQSAIHDMVQSPASQRERLAAAWDSFHPIFLERQDLPPDLARELTQLHARMTAVGEKTLEVVSDLEIRRIARMICDLECTATWHLERLKKEQEEEAPICGAV